MNIKKIHCSTAAQQGGNIVRDVPASFIAAVHTARNGQYGTENHVIIENTDAVGMNLDSRFISSICSPSQILNDWRFGTLHAILMVSGNRSKIFLFFLKIV